MIQQIMHTLVSIAVSSMAGVLGHRINAWLRTTARTKTTGAPTPSIQLPPPYRTADVPPSDDCPTCGKPRPCGLEDVDNLTRELVMTLHPDAYWQKLMRIHEVQIREASLDTEQGCRGRAPSGQ